MKAIRFLGVLALACLASGPPSAQARAAGEGGAPGATPGTPALSAEDRAIYAKALRLAKAKRFDAARETGRAAQDARLGKLILWLDLTTPGPENVAFPIVATFLARNPDWPGRRALRLRAERAMPEDMPDPAVLSWFAARAALSPEGATRHAEALIRAGRRDRAVEVVRAAWVEMTFAGAEEDAILARFGSFLRKADHVARLDRLLAARSYRAARRQARRLGRDYAALAEARLRLAADRPGVDSAIARVPEALLGDPGFVYERARWRQRRGRYDDVVALLDPPDPGAPGAERWWRPRRWTVRRALAKGDISVAYRIARHHGMVAGTGFAEAEWLAGWIALRFLDQPREAYGHFTRLHEGVSSPVSLGRGAFWAGEAARALARRDTGESWGLRAHQWYATAAAHDTSFYGQLASRRLGRGPTIDLTARIAPCAASRKAFEVNELVKIVRLLDELDERALLERFLARLRALAEIGQDYVLIAELAGALGRPDLAMRTARAARSLGIILPEHLFPDMPLPDADRPETALLLALIRQESGFYPEAVSRAGARGLMQIMPATARQVARRIKVAYNSDKLLSDPQYNLLLGQRYLSDLLDRYDGSYVLALAAYNAGPARANSWIDAFGDPRDPDVDAVDWIESIPLDETRNYVQRVLESLVAYRQKLGVAPAGGEGLPKLNPLGSLQQQGAAPRRDLSCCL